MSLLDGNYTPDPLSMGLLALGSSMMTPRALGGGIGPGMNAFAQQAMAAQQMRRQQEQDALQRKLFDLRLGEAAESAEERRRKRDMDAALQKAARDAYTPASPGSLGGGVTPGSEQGRMLLSQASGDPEFDAAMLGATNSALNTVGPQQPISAPTAGGFSRQRFVNNLYGAGLAGEAMKVEDSMAKDSPFGKVDAKDFTPESIAKFSMTRNYADLVPVRERKFVNGTAVDPTAIEPGTVVPQQAPWEYEIGPDGRPRMRPEVFAAKQRIAAAGASNIGMPRVEVKMGDSVGGQVGPILKESMTAVGGAVKMADAAERIITAVDQGGVIAGPAASLRLKGAQVASLFGIGGKDAVAQTRQVIRGLAESSVEARKELAGQGQVTDNEAKAVDKALSGNIDDLTVDEIRDIARLNLRHAAMRARQHQQYLSAMPESMSAARPFYTVPGMERLLNMDPARYEIRRPAGANVAPDGQSARGTIGQPTVDDLLRKYGGGR
jgi:hypothetical protein